MSQTSTHSLEGRKREERVCELQNVARHKRALTSWRGERGRSGMGSFQTWHVTNEHSRAGRDDGGGMRGGACGRRTFKKNNDGVERTRCREEVKVAGDP